MTNPAKQAGGIAVAAFCIAFFVLCLALWAVSAPFVFKCLGMEIRGEADGLGMSLLVVFPMGAIGICMLGIAVLIAVFARRLSLWFRVVSLLPGAVAILLAAAMVAIGLLHEFRDQYLH